MVVAGVFTVAIRVCRAVGAGLWWAGAGDGAVASVGGGAEAVGGAEALMLVDAVGEAVVVIVVVGEA